MIFLLLIGTFAMVVMIVTISVIPQKKWKAIVGGIFAALIWTAVMGLFILAVAFNNALSPGPSHTPAWLSGILPLVWLGVGWGVIWLIAYGSWRSWWIMGGWAVGRKMREVGREFCDEIRQLFS